MAWRCPTSNPEGVGLAFQLESQQERDDIDRIFYRILDLYLRSDENPHEATAGE